MRQVIFGISRPAQEIQASSTMDSIIQTALSTISSTAASVSPLDRQLKAALDNDKQQKRGRMDQWPTNVLMKLQAHTS